MCNDFPYGDLLVREVIGSATPLGVPRKRPRAVT
jgi:hypothetical protein